MNRWAGGWTGGWLTGWMIQNMVIYVFTQPYLSRDCFGKQNPDSGFTNIYYDLKSQTLPLPLHTHFFFHTHIFEFLIKRFNQLMSG